jgi:hypothetical protein
MSRHGSTDSIQILRGDPSDEELAALTAVLQPVLRGGREPGPAPGPPQAAPSPAWRQPRRTSTPHRVAESWSRSLGAWGQGRQGSP